MRRRSLYRNTLIMLLLLVGCRQPVAVRVSVDPRLPAQAGVRVAEVVRAVLDLPAGAVAVVPLQESLEPFPSKLEELQSMTPELQRRALREPWRHTLGILRTGQGLPLALVPELAPADRAAALMLPELAGLGLPAQASADGAGLVSDFPVAMLSWKAWTSQTPAEQRRLVLHELGHAAGLPHDQRPGNAMAPQPGVGEAWLDVRQRARLDGLLRDMYETTRKGQ